MALETACTAARIIPAYAGSTGGTGIAQGADKDHPRIRGEHIQDTPLTNVTPGSSPHTRGARTWSMCRGRARRIIPAYAGSTPASTATAAARRDHPRIRGEHSACLEAGLRSRGSSPHTRGAHPLPRPARLGRGIIPAYAGSTPTRWRKPASGADHPRIRGEHADASDGNAGQSGSSPHTRGARTRNRCGRISRRIIPAYAGSTIKGLWDGIKSGDHPRIRGEHKKHGKGVKMPLGSSPHTRGARRPMVPRQSACRIIPAYAGSTRSARR